MGLWRRGLPIPTEADPNTSISHLEDAIIGHLLDLFTALGLAL